MKLHPIAIASGIVVAVPVILVLLAVWVVFLFIAVAVSRISQTFDRWRGPHKGPPP